MSDAGETHGAIAQFTRNLLLALVVLTATGATVSAGEYTDIHAVAVVSAIGDSLEFTKVEFHLGPYHAPTFPIDWGIDAWMQQQITAALSNHFVIKPVPVNRIALSQCDGFEQCADALPKTDGVDAYILIFKHWRGDPIGGTRDIRGIGLYHNPGVIGASSTFVYAIYVVAVIDAKTGRMIGHGTGRMGEAGFLGSYDDPIEKVSEGLWADSPDQFSNEQQSSVKGTVLRLLEVSLPHALRNANLIGSQ
jgi:hypothetical protein